MLKDAGKRVRDVSQPAYARQAAVGGLVQQCFVPAVDSEAFTALFPLPARAPDSSAQGMNCRSTSVASPPAKNPPGHTLGPKKEGGVLQDAGKQVSVTEPLTPRVSSSVTRLPRRGEPSLSAETCRALPWTRCTSGHSSRPLVMSSVRHSASPPSAPAGAQSGRLYA